MRSLVALTRSEFLLYLREPVGVFFILVFPVMLVLIFGSIFGNEPTAEAGGQGQLDVSMQGYMALVIGNATLMALPVTIASYRERGVLKRLKATPLSPLPIVASYVLVSLVMAIVGVIILLIVGRLVFDLNLPQAPFGTSLGWLVGYVSFAALSFLLGSVVTSSRAANAVASALFFPQLFLSGAAGIPRFLFPDWLQDVTEYLPLSQVVNLVGSLWSGDGWDGTATIYLLVLTGVAGVLSVRVFRWE